MTDLLEGMMVLGNYNKTYMTRNVAIFRYLVSIPTDPLPALLVLVRVVTALLGEASHQCRPAAAAQERQYLEMKTLHRSNRTISGATISPLADQMVSSTGRHYWRNACLMPPSSSTARSGRVGIMVGDSSGEYGFGQRKNLPMRRLCLVVLMLVCERLALVWIT
jgi:hypothetical protein